MVNRFIAVVAATWLLFFSGTWTPSAITTTTAFRPTITAVVSKQIRNTPTPSSITSTNQWNDNIINKHNIHNHKMEMLQLYAASSEAATATTTTTITTSPSTEANQQPNNKRRVRRIGIFGGGTVGGGIVEILQTKKDYFEQMTNCEIEIVKICVNDVTKKRDFTIPDGTILTTNYDDILKDDTIDLVVEVMGGTDDAKTIVWNALKVRKDVVTANKALIAKHLPEIESILKEVNSNSDGTTNNVSFRFEAAVCGGIPIIRSMQTDYVGDDVTMFSGIINGCTNYMLTAMDQNGMTYDEALAAATKLGYAEADPTLDVGGFDARSKLRILMRLAFGVEVDEDQIACRGITELSKLDFAYAKMMGGTIKLIGCAKTTGTTTDDKVAAFVSPCYITGSDALASVNGATNAIEIISKNLQCSTYIGQGAGRYPTANSCVNDIITIVKGDPPSIEAFNPSAPHKKFVQDFDSVFYIRLRYKDQVGITRQCGEICEKHNVSIHSILQNPITRRDDAAFVLVTEKVPLAAVKKVCAEIEELDWCNAPTFYMPVLREDWVQAMVPN